MQIILNNPGVPSSYKRDGRILMNIIKPPAEAQIWEAHMPLHQTPPLFISSRDKLFPGLF